MSDPFDFLPTGASSHSSTPRAANAALPVSRTVKPTSGQPSAPARKSTQRKPAPRKELDWEQAHALYRTGQWSDVALGEIIGCSGQAVGVHAKKHGWVRDLVTLVNASVSAAATHPRPYSPPAQARARPADHAPSDPTSPADPSSISISQSEIDPAGCVSDGAALRPADWDDKLIEAAANRAMGVQDVHQIDVRALGKLCHRLMAQLELATAHEDDIRRWSLAFLAGDGSTPQQIAEKRKAINSLLTLAFRSSVMRNLTASYERLQRMERIGHGLDPSGSAATGPGGGPPAAADSMPVEQRLKAYRDEAARAAAISEARNVVVMPAAR